MQIEIFLKFFVRGEDFWCCYCYMIHNLLLLLLFLLILLLSFYFGWRSV